MEASHSRFYRREAGILPDPEYGGKGDPVLERSPRKKEAPCQ
jgi:hypothetical protein